MMKRVSKTEKCGEEEEMMKRVSKIENDLFI